MPSRQTVAVVDDDESIREALPPLLRSFGYEVRSFESAREFLADADMGDVGCLVLDIAMPGMSGPELQDELIERGLDIPIVFITARGRDEVAPDLIRKGAVECLLKPFSEGAILEAVRSALARTPES